MEKSQRIKILRILCGFTQAALANAAGLTQVSIVAWEQGNYNPASAAAESLAPILGCTPGYIMFGTPPIDAAVWMPVPPTRPHHLKKMINDLLALFPEFMAEHGINFMVGLRVKDGGIFMLGREEACVDYILMAQTPVYDIFFEILKKCRLHKIIDELNMSISDQRYNDIGYFSNYAKLHGWKINADGLGCSLVIKRAYPSIIKINKDSLEIICRAVLHVTNSFYMSVDEEEKVARLVTQKVDELAPLFTDKIKVVPIMEELMENLKSMGFKEKEPGKLKRLFDESPPDNSSKDKFGRT